MNKKTPAGRQSPPRPEEGRPSASELLAMAAQACLTAKDAAYNLRELIADYSGMALATVRQCERELDAMERQIDRQLPQAMVRMTEPTAREVLATIRFIADLERIGDLMLWVAERSNLRRWATLDKTTLGNMLVVLENMLGEVHEGLSTRDPQFALSVLQQDRKLDRLRQQTFQRHLAAGGKTERLHSIDVLMAAQSIERAGDHATNLAEELVHLIEHRSIRHAKLKVVED